jgi:BirA family biotin operon repressor/biotin-[acetyl-CoA-carboxylase] ligase
MRRAISGEKGWLLEILFHNELDSTQEEVKRCLLAGRKPPFCVVASNQTAGTGSRENRWDSIEGNLFFSFVIEKSDLPEDIPLSSASIYFGYLMKQRLAAIGSAAWLKWPNDLYVKTKKIGGVITHVRGNHVVCGIGVNLVASGEYAALDIKVEKKTLLKSYLSDLNTFPTWKKIFRQYRVEFAKSKGLKTHADGEEVSLENALLECDGSLTINGKRVFSLR